MRNKKKILFIVSVFILLLFSFQLCSCSLMENIKGILEGFQSGKPESTKTISSEGWTPEDDENKRDDTGGDFYPASGDDTETQQEFSVAESYQITQADRKGLQRKVEAEHYIFYFNEIDEDFLNDYIQIAESGWEGLEVIFGEVLDKKIEIFLCNTTEEFETVTGGMTPPGFDGSKSAGQASDGEVHIYKAEGFKPVPDIVDEETNYRIGLLHEIGHAYYFWVYPEAAKKNEWLNEALADKSISGSFIDPNSISNETICGVVSGGNFIPILELESKGVRYLGQDGTFIFSEYISFVNFISMEFGFEALNLFLSEYNNQKDLLTSLETATGLSPASFEEQWLDAIGNGY